MQAPVSSGKPVPQTCTWCGKFIAVIPVGEKPLSFELARDERDRLVMDENDTFVVSSEHLCRVRCSRCGSSLIFEGGSLFERSETKMAISRIPHRCARQLLV